MIRKIDVSLLEISLRNLVALAEAYERDEPNCMRIRVLREWAERIHYESVDVLAKWEK